MAAAKKARGRVGSRASTGRAAYRRVVLKISGEGFCRPGQFGIDGEMIDRIAAEIIDVVKLGVQVGVVVGGGNFLRGATLAEKSHIQPATAHYMGMLATVINALALQEMLELRGQPTRVQSSIAISAACEPFIRRRCIRHLEKGRVVILAAGTGRPFVTTDSAAALAAVEIGADVVLKATKVDGVYTADPMRDRSARRYDALTYNQVINDRLKVMDVSAIDMCQQNGVPIVVFNLTKAGNMKRVVLGEPVGTRIDH
ncbi:MAG: UMP kinase [Phycisphaerae bacterium]|nr:UMP kinase [Phycisphaerae bacterium]